MHSVRVHSVVTGEWGMLQVVSVECLSTSGGGVTGEWRLVYIA